jgi:hypothetical protein
MIFLFAACLALQDDTCHIEVTRTGGLAGAHYDVRMDGKKVWALAGTARDVKSEAQLSDEEYKRFEKMANAVIEKKVDTHYGSRDSIDAYKYSISLWYKKGGKPERLEIIVFRDGSWANTVPQELKDLIKEMIDLGNRTINPPKKG